LPKASFPPNIAAEFDYCRQHSAYTRYFPPPLPNHSTQQQPSQQLSSSSSLSALNAMVSSIGILHSLVYTHVDVTVRAADAAVIDGSHGGGDTPSMTLTLYRGGVATALAAVANVHASLRTFASAFSGGGGGGGGMRAECAHYERYVASLHGLLRVWASVHDNNSDAADCIVRSRGDADGNINSGVDDESDGSENDDERAWRLRRARAHVATSGARHIADACAHSLARLQATFLGVPPPLRLRVASAYAAAHVLRALPLPLSSPLSTTTVHTCVAAVSFVATVARRCGEAESSFLQAAVQMMMAPRVSAATLMHTLLLLLVPCVPCEPSSSTAAPSPGISMSMHAAVKVARARFVSLPIAMLPANTAPLTTMLLPVSSRTRPFVLSRHRGRASPLRLHCHLRLTDVRRSDLSACFLQVRRTPLPASTSSSKSTIVSTVSSPADAPSPPPLHFPLLSASTRCAPTGPPGAFDVSLVVELPTSLLAFVSASVLQMMKATASNRRPVSPSPQTLDVRVVRCCNVIDAADAAHTLALTPVQHFYYMPRPRS
jgi:hypothetical protein